MWRKLFSKLFNETDVARLGAGLAQSTVHSEKLRREKPVLYWLFVVVMLIVLLTPMVAFCLWTETIVPAPENRLVNIAAGLLVIVGVAASLVFGVALVNELMRVVRGYLGWKVTALCAIVGTAMMLLCTWAMSLLP